MLLICSCSILVKSLSRPYYVHVGLLVCFCHVLVMCLICSRYVIAMLWFVVVLLAFVIVLLLL